MAAPKTDMLWFSGTREDEDDQRSYTKMYDASPQKIGERRTGGQGQRTLDGFSKVMQATAQTANIPSNRLNLSHQRSNSKEAGHSAFTQQRNTVATGSDRAFDFKSPKKELTHRETTREAGSPPKNPS